MINVLFYCTAKPGQSDAMRALLAEMQRVSRTEDQAVTYTFMQHKEDPAEFALFEQWRDKVHLGGHIENMKKHFGEPPPGAPLPAKLQALTAKSSFQFYRLVDGP
jgi:quinol monooxygenase YgiN